MSARGKTAIVTGAAGGIGAATANVFVKNGWEVISIDRLDMPSSNGRSVRADLSDARELNRCVSEISTGFKKIDALINNAALQILAPAIKTDPADWDKVMATNVRAIYQLVTALYPLLKNAPGAVVNVASVHAVATSPGIAAYAASKGALVALTRAMALEFAADGVRVNAVLPGAIETSMLREGLKRSQSSLEELAARHPLQRVGRPEDVAEAIFFLADSGRSSFITGQTLIVDGGATARLSTE
jgi:NAD(P)-dependent dehydrogenase (short-subunit alcohol dehydrogenase family)